MFNNGSGTRVHACIAWVLLLYDLTAMKRLSHPHPQPRHYIWLENCKESPRFISSVCEHVSCKEVCLSWRRRSGLPEGCSTPEEKRDRHTDVTHGRNKQSRGSRRCKQETRWRIKRTYKTSRFGHLWEKICSIGQVVIIHLCQQVFFSEQKQLISHVT